MQATATKCILLTFLWRQKSTEKSRSQQFHAFDSAIWARVRVRANICEWPGSVCVWILQMLKFSKPYYWAYIRYATYTNIDHMHALHTFSRCVHKSKTENICNEMYEFCLWSVPHTNKHTHTVSKQKIPSPVAILRNQQRQEFICFQYYTHKESWDLVLFLLFCNVSGSFVRILFFLIHFKLSAFYVFFCPAPLYSRALSLLISHKIAFGRTFTPGRNIFVAGLCFFSTSVQWDFPRFFFFSVVFYKYCMDYVRTYAPFLLTETYIYF